MEQRLDSSTWRQRNLCSQRLGDCVQWNLGPLLLRRRRRRPLRQQQQQLMQQQFQQHRSQQHQPG